VALLGRSGDGSVLVLGPVRAIEPDAALRRDKSWEVKRDAQDRVIAQVVELCREYGAQAYTDQHEQAVVARPRELGLKTTMYAMNRERKHAAFKQLRDVLYHGLLVLPDHGPLLDEMMRVQVNLEQAGPKIILPRSSSGHRDQILALAPPGGCSSEGRPERSLRRSLPHRRALCSPGQRRTRFRPPQGQLLAVAFATAGTDSSTARCTSSLSPRRGSIPKPAPT